MTALTSRLAFHATVSERERQGHQLMGVYLSSGPMSDREASYRLGWERASVSARRNDLMKQEKVRELGRKKDETTGKTVNIYGVVRNTLFD